MAVAVDADQQPAAPEGPYGNFFIILDHFLRTSQLHTTLHTPCYMFYLVPMLIGGWLGLGIRCCDRFGASGRQRGSDMSDHKKHMASLRRSMYRTDSSQLDLGPGRSSSARASPDRPIRKTSGGGILKSVEPGGNATGASHSARDRTLSDPDDLL